MVSQQSNKNNNNNNTNNIPRPTAPSDHCDEKTEVEATCSQMSTLLQQLAALNFYIKEGVQAAGASKLADEPKANEAANGATPVAAAAGMGIIL